MKLLTDIWHLPMVMNFIIPLSLVALLVGFLLWESRLPAEKKILRKLRIRKHKPAAHKHS